MQGNDAQLGLDTSAGPRGYASWQHPFQDTRIYLAQGVLRKLSSEALRGLRKPQVSEVGGILWGKSRDRSEDPIVITDAELIPSGAELYNTTPADASNLLR